MKGTQKEQDHSWRWYLVAPKGAIPLWFGLIIGGCLLVASGCFLLLGSVIGSVPLGWWSERADEVLALTVVGALLVVGGVYLKRTNPRLGIIEPPPQSSELDRPQRRR